MIHNVRNAWFQAGRGFLPSWPSSPAPFPSYSARLGQSGDRGLGGELASALHAL